MSSEIFPLILGLVLGLKHAFEPDHLIAVSTIVVNQKNPFKASLIGTFWGLGHTTTLLLVGFLVLFLGLSIPGNISTFFESFVGIMLIFLGFKVIKQARVAIHTHKKHHTPFLIGSIHGLAGSGSLMLLVLATIPSITSGLIYILLFGMGSILGMTLMSFLLSLPFIFSNKFPEIEKFLKIVAGILSILFGIYWVFEVIQGI